MAILIGARKALLYAAPASVVASTDPAWSANHGTANSASATNATLTISGADVAAGSFFYMVFWCSNSRSVSGGVSDDAAGGPNTYSVSSYSIVAPGVTTNRIHLVKCKATVAMPVGTIITATMSGGMAYAAVAQSFTTAAASPIDLTGSGVTGGPDTTPIIPSPGTPSQAVSLELATVWSPTASGGSETLTATGWSNQLSVSRGTSGRIFLQSRLSTDGTAAGLTGTITTSGAWSGRIETIKGS